MSAPVASPTPGVEEDLDAVRALQRALYRAAKADPGRRFHSLYDKVHRRDVLERAWVQVRRNAGAPGIDQTTFADIEAYGVSRLLDELEAELREGRFKALPARRVYIPKPGQDELRPLSIPAIRDRVVQAAVKIVLEPVFEADMLACSFGFRPKRSAHDALQVVIDESFGGRRWVVETDIANCFTAIPHQGLMSALSERICDRKVLALLRAFLRAGVMEDGAVRRSVSGTPQGGVVSPLLCNVYLNRLDRAWRPAYGRLVRYADDRVPRTQGGIDVEGRTQRAVLCQRWRFGPSGAALQGEASNHRKVRRLRAGVPSVAEKAHCQCVEWRPRYCAVRLRRDRECRPRIAQCHQHYWPCRPLSNLTSEHSLQPRPIPRLPTKQSRSTRTMRTSTARWTLQTRVIQRCILHISSLFATLGTSP